MDELKAVDETYVIIKVIQRREDNTWSHFTPTKDSLKPSSEAE